MDAAAAKSASIAQDTGDDRAGEDGAARLAAVGAEILGDTGWSEAKLADGGAYYFKASGETTWDVPPEVVAYKQRIKGSETQEAAGQSRENPAISGVSEQRAVFGATINRLQYAVDNLSNVSLNTSASRSQVQDADYAKETSELARTQIIQQAATAMLSQANTLPQTVLQLLQQ